MAAHKVSLRSKPVAPRESGWKLPLVLGILLPILIWGLFRYMSPPVDAQLAAVARREGWDVQTYGDVMQLMEKAGKAGDLDEKDWNRLMQILHNSSVDMREDALATLGQMRQSKHREEIVRIGTTFLNDQHPDDKNNKLQSSALVLLWKMQASSWKAEVMQRRNTANPLMRHAVDMILAKEEIKQ